MPIKMMSIAINTESMLGETIETITNSTARFILVTKSRAHMVAKWYL